MKSWNSRAFPVALALSLLVAACAPKETRTPKQLMDLGVAAWAGGRTREAEDLLQRCVDRAEKSGPDKHGQRVYHFAQFQFYAAQNLLARAESAYVGVETTTDFMINEEAGHNLGVLRMRAGKYREAAEILAATRASLDSTMGPNDERPITLMVLMHLDLARSATGNPDARLPADILQLFDEMVQFQMGGYPKLHPALMREIKDYSARLQAQGRNSESQAIHDRLTIQLARDAAPGSADGSCLTLMWEPPLGCILGLEQ